MKRIKITTIVGTRPEIIRLSSTIKLLERYFDHRLVHTGQNAGADLKDIFFEELSIREPDLQVDLTSLTLGSNLAKIFVSVEQELLKNKPDAVVVLGDTNSALSVIIAKRMNIPVYHLEAGNRSFDLNVPEEINRKIVDHTADFNLVYSEHARRNLINEGIHPRTICLIGSPMNEVLSYNLTSIQKRDTLERLNLKPGEYFVLSAHRQENIDSQTRLSELIKMINEVATKFNLPIIVSTHPRIKEKLSKMNIEINGNVQFHTPLGFFDYCNLQINSLLTISDSGSVSEESAILGFKAVTLRDSMERPEALESGTILMSGINSKSLLAAIEYKLESKPISHFPPEYFIQNSSERVVNFILSTIHNRNFWSGIRN